MHERTILKSYVRDCTVSLIVGVMPHEKETPQDVIFNVEMTMVAAQPFEEQGAEDLSLVLDYSKLRAFLCDELPKRGPVPLLETLGDMVLAFCFEDSKVRRVKVRIEKPHIYPETQAVGIEMTRTREAVVV